MSQIKKNVLYNLIYSLSQFLFPIITFPYVSSILGPDRFGALSFSDTYSKYFAIIAALGIPIYGVREIAKAKASSGQVNTVFSEVFLVHLGSSVVALAIYLFSVYSIPKLREELPLHLISAINIIALPFVFDWFFSGIEEFRVIMMRSLLARFIPLLFLFVLVKEKDDYLIYQALNMSALLLNGVFNGFFIRKHVKFAFGKLNVLKHIKPLTLLFFSTMLISLYTMLDVVMLGFLDNDRAVGLYSASIKINKLIIMGITSVGTVLLARISSMMQSNDLVNAQLKIEKSLAYCSFVAIPAMVGLMLLRDETLFLFSGIEFMDASDTMLLLTPVILILTFSNVFGVQILLPLEKDKQFLYCVLAGTIANVVLNFLLIPTLSYNGAAISTLCTEFFVTLGSFVLARQALPFRFPWPTIFRSVLFSLFFVPVIYLLREMNMNAALLASSGILVCSILYVGLQWLSREPLMIEVSKNFKLLVSKAR